MVKNPVNMKLFEWHNREKLNAFHGDEAPVSAVNDVTYGKVGSMRYKPITMGTQLVS